jgi:hypothetical protein
MLLILRHVYFKLILCVVRTKYMNLTHNMEVVSLSLSIYIYIYIYIYICMFHFRNYRTNCCYKIYCSNIILFHSVKY